MKPVAVKAEELSGKNEKKVSNPDCRVIPRYELSDPKPTSIFQCYDPEVKSPWENDLHRDFNKRTCGPGK